MPEAGITTGKGVVTEKNEASGPVRVAPLTVAGLVVLRFLSETDPMVVGAEGRVPGKTGELEITTPLAGVANGSGMMSRLSKVS